MGKKKKEAPVAVKVLEAPVQEQARQLVSAPPSRADLAGAVKAELIARSKRCMMRVEAILREENCVLEAIIRLPEVSPGVFGISSEPGVRAL
jgi:hypothetical protein